jgi:hypothetical protein
MPELFEAPEAACPTCGRACAGDWSARLRLASMRLRGRRLARARLWCARCAHYFGHLHVEPRRVVGYHGCRRDLARALVTGRLSAVEWQASQNDYDWLGAGVYFWEEALGRAWQWARERFGDDGAVVAVEIELGRCLDLGDTRYTGLLQAAYEGAAQAYALRGEPLPQNGGRDFKLRRLDRLVVDRLTNNADRGAGVFFQTVRCPFEEGPAVYPGGMIRSQSHVQVVVRDRACIGSPIYPVDALGRLT